MIFIIGLQNTEKRGKCVFDMISLWSAKGMQNITLHCIITDNFISRGPLTMGTKSLFRDCVETKCIFRPFWAYFKQTQGHIGWATTMPFASINSTNPRTNEIFEKNIENWRFWKSHFWVGHFEFSFFCFFHIKRRQSFLLTKDGSK